jgi:hypothetical protein
MLLNSIRIIKVNMIRENPKMLTIPLNSMLIESPNRPEGLEELPLKWG